MNSIIKIIKVGLLYLFIAIPLWSAGQSEAGGSQSRGKYLVDQGRIIPASEIHVDSYIAQVNYNYPAPAEDVGVSFLSGQHLVSPEGQELILQIGIQGRQGSFSGLPPLNLCFVLDISGSMADPDKIDWLKQGMARCLKKIRGNDTVSIITAGQSVDIILAPVKARNIREPEKLINQIGELRPYGVTNLAAGIKQGYIFLEQEYHPTHVNRLILLSDGMDTYEDLLAIPGKYKAKGINITTIGFGMSYNLDVMMELAKAGGGSSRFINDTAKLEEVFDTEFDRMIVPVARNIHIKVTFLSEVAGLETWGYEHRIGENTIEYFLPTLHFRDYETTVIRFQLPAFNKAGPVTLARLELDYTDLSGKRIQHKPLSLQVTIMPRGLNSGISNPTVLKAGTMLKLALALQDIGYLHTFHQSQYQDTHLYRESNFSVNHVESDTPAEQLIRKENTEVNSHYLFSGKRALDITLLALKEIEITRLCLEEQLFEDEEYILQKYCSILGRSAGYYGNQLEEVITRKEMRKEYASVSREEILQGMLAELLVLCKPGELIAYNGFHAETSSAPSFVQQIDGLTGKLVKDHGRIKFFASWATVDAGEPSNRELALVLGEDHGAAFFMTGFIRMQESTALLILRLYNCTTGELAAVTRATIAVK